MQGLFLQGINRHTDKWTISGDKPGTTLTFHTFCRKMVSSCFPINDKEVQRHCLFIQCEKSEDESIAHLMDLTLCDFDWSARFRSYWNSNTALRAVCLILSIWSYKSLREVKSMVTEAPSLWYITLEFHHPSLMEDEILLHYCDYLNEDGTFDGQAFGEAITAIFEGMEKEIANPHSVPDGLGLDYLRYQGACKIQDIRQYEREREDEFS